MKKPSRPLFHGQRVPLTINKKRLPEDDYQEDVLENFRLDTAAGIENRLREVEERIEEEKSAGRSLLSFYEQDPDRAALWEHASGTLLAALWHRRALRDPEVKARVFELFWVYLHDLIYTWVWERSPDTLSARAFLADPTAVKPTLILPTLRGKNAKRGRATTQEDPQQVDTLRATIRKQLAPEWQKPQHNTNLRKTKSHNRELRKMKIRAVLTKTLPGLEWEDHLEAWKYLQADEVAVEAVGSGSTCRRLLSLAAGRTRREKPRSRPGV